MRTITVDILDDKVMALLKNLEQLGVIRLRRTYNGLNISSKDFILKYKGLMQKQPISEIDKQLNNP